MEVTSVRSEFPALQKCPDYVFGDAPTGTQCHASVAEAVKGYLENPGAHLMGSYPGAINTQATTTKARISAAAFFNCKPEEVCILLMGHTGAKTTFCPEIHLNFVKNELLNFVKK